MSVVAEVQAPLVSGGMREAVDEWVVAVGGATKTIRPSWAWMYQSAHGLLYVNEKGKKQENER
jgi:hypothetical protein